MDIRNSSNMSFQARIPKEVKNHILDMALDYGTKSLKNAKRQIRNIEGWGSPDYVLDMAYVLKKDDAQIINFKPERFALAKDELSAVALPKRKNSIFSSFMAIRENDILNAEKELSKVEGISYLDLFM